MNSIEIKKTKKDYLVFYDIVGYEGTYQINKLGEIRSLNRKVSNGKGYYIKKGINIKQTLNKKGYYVVSLHKNGQKKNICVHQLMAYQFLNHTPCGYKIVVDHIDNNPQNNRLDNLQLVTNRLNCSKDKKNKTSKYTGVSYDEKRDKYSARITIGNKNVFLGRYKSEYFANLAYQQKLRNLKFINNYENQTN